MLGFYVYNVQNIFELLLNEFLGGSAKAEQMFFLVRSKIGKLIAGHFVGDQTLAVLLVVGDNFPGVFLEDLTTIFVILAG